MDTSQSDNLRPCPFCGMQSENARKHLTDCFFSYLNDGDLEKAMTVYNTRPLEDALQRKLDVAVEAFRMIEMITVNDGRSWNVDLIEERIQNVIDTALAQLTNNVE